MNKTLNPETSGSRIALITGASSGIGKALAEEFAGDGYDLVLAARNVVAMEALAGRLRQAHGVTIAVIGVDLESPGGATLLHTEVQARRLKLHVLVNNAGYGSYGEFKDSAPRNRARHDESQHDRPGGADQTVPSRPDRHARQDPQHRIHRRVPTGPYMAVYYATKAFVLSLSEALAAELADDGVTVTALCPGPTASGFQDKADMHDSALVKGKKLPTAQAVARQGFQALKRGQRVFIPGAMNWLMAQSLRFTPRRVVTAMVKTLSKPA